MRYARQLSVSRPWLVGALTVGAALVVGCHGEVGKVGSTGGGNTAGGGMGGGPANPCTGAADPRLVPASQRIMLLTSREVVNTVRYLVDNTIATQVLNSGMFNVTSELDRKFPPAVGEVAQIADTTQLQPWNNLAAAVAQYVFDNFGTVTGCATPTDACATMYLNRLAEKAYRRALTPEEQTRFTGLYTRLKTQNVNGYVVTGTVEEATQMAVHALLMTPQMVWRWELGNTAAPAMSTSPPGIYLSDNELASQVSFFLTDMPPDPELLAAAKAGTVRANLNAHITRILATQPAKDWMRTVIETFYLINQLPGVLSIVDPAKFPVVSAGLLRDMQLESQKFLDNALWSGKLVDLLTSRTAFLNTGLATEIYKVPVPAGASATNFVKTTLPMDQRSGIITNAGFITRAARSDKGGVVPRGLAIKAAMLCLVTPPPPAEIGPAVEAAKVAADAQTVQEQVAYRKNISLCNGCHGSFDSYGLVLDNYDNIGIWRTIDDLGKPVNASTTLPPELGGAAVTSAVDLAQKLSTSSALTNCLATSVLQYAMTDYTAPVELPLPTQPGCAATDVVQRYSGSSNKSFTDLVVAVAASPAFVLRKAAP